MTPKGLTILKTKPRSRAAKLGLKSGDRILTVNGHEVTDELSLRFYLSEGPIDLCILRANGCKKTFRIDLPDTASLGVCVEEFRTKTCSNACLFCFVDQLPPNARPSLRVKDDDYRLSFLHGNYITLTNLGGRDLDRIAEQRLSPLYLSVHTTNPMLRAKILGRKKPDDLSGKILKLITHGIRIHSQIVLMPGINDGPHLEKTVFDLYRWYPGIQSIAIVPVGLSGHGAAKDFLTAATPEYSRSVIFQAQQWQARFRKEIARTFACLADEFYLQAGWGVPEKDSYDDFAQIEDGVGMVRRFLDDFKAEMASRRRLHSELYGTLATGRLFYPVLRRCMEQFNRKFGSRLKVRAVENRFLGGRITVAGLLGGKDILAALAGKDVGDFLVIPGEALASANDLLIDDTSPKDISKALGKPVYSGGRTVRDLFHILSEIKSIAGSRRASIIRT